MSQTLMKIGVVAPGGPLKPEVAEAVQALVHSDFAGRAEVLFHPQCFEVHNHFAGDDQRRADALVEVANDPEVDAIWFGRGGYGTCRIVDAVVPRLNDHARVKTYLGYSDVGALLGAFYGRGIGQCAHGPMPTDIRRDGGEAAVRRALAWLIDRDPSALEPSVSIDPAPTAAFNIAVLSQIVGTPWQPDLTGHVLMLEEVSEYMYRIDRYLFQITSNLEIRRVAGLRLGRCSDIPPNDPAFGLDEEQIAEFWCTHAGIPYLGRADIGHDVENKVTPFGRANQREG